MAVTLEGAAYTPTVGAQGAWGPDGVSPSCFQYMRVADVVTVSGEVNIDAAGAGQAQFYITLPTMADFEGGSCLLAGTGAGEYGTFEGADGVVPARIYGDTNNARAIVEFYCYCNNASCTFKMSVHFTYLVV